MSILNTSPHQNNHVEPVNKSPRKTKGKGILLGVVIAVLVGANVYLLSRVEGLEAETAHLQVTMEEQIGGVEETSSLYAGQSRREMEALRQEIEKAREEAAGRAAREAQRQSSRVAKTLSEQQQRQQNELMTGVHDARTIADEANGGVKVVRNDLMSVKAEVEDTNTHLHETASLLDQTASDLGEISGLVSDNRSEIVSLRKLTDRNRVNFSLAKSKDLQRVADIQLRLRDTDIKHNKFTIEILADDRKFVKKNRHVAEPVVFYMGDAQQPYELVITSMKKGAVSGYLARPQVQMARR